MPDDLAPHFKRVLDALALASPLCLATRFDDPARCIEASISTEKALKRRRIKAEAIPCGLVFRRGEVGIGVGDVDPDHADVEYLDHKPDLKTRMHMVVEARFAGRRVIIDPTFGQARALGVDVSLHATFNVASGWPSATTVDGWDFSYVDARMSRTELDDLTADYRKLMHGLTGDLDTLIDTAIDAGLDRDRFYARCAQGMPKEFATAMGRLRRWAVLGAPPESRQ